MPPQGLLLALLGAVAVISVVLPALIASAGIATTVVAGKYVAVLPEEGSESLGDRGATAPLQEEDQRPWEPTASRNVHAGAFADRCCAHVPRHGAGDAAAAVTGCDKTRTKLARGRRLQDIGGGNREPRNRGHVHLGFIVFNRDTTEG